MIIYDTKKDAEAAAYGDEIVTKVCGGWAVMKVSDYNTWREQK